MSVTPELLLRAYSSGVFPMAENRDDSTLYWVDPDERGVLPLDEFHIPKRLARTVRKQTFEVRVDTAFEQIIRACAESNMGREETWINDQIVAAYTELAATGHAHSVECWRDNELCGGLYGVRIGGAFFGESMFTRRADASKVALVHLVARLIAGGFVLLDTQFVTKHLETFGAREISRTDYHQVLDEALRTEADFYSFSSDGNPDGVLQAITQTS
jgi:leucyl/phenylalanyl-tRNA--protein transferase